MGLIGAAFGLGFIIGPALGGLLAGNDPATADVADPGLGRGRACRLLALCGVVLLLPGEPAGGRRGAGRSRSRLARDLGRARAARCLSRLILIFFLVILAFAGMESTFALWAIAQFGWGPRQVGYVFSYVGVLSAILQGGLIGALTRRFGEERLLLWRARADRRRAAAHAAGAQRARCWPRRQRAGARHGADAALAQQPDLAPRRARGAGRGAGRGAIGRQPVARARPGGGRVSVRRVRPQRRVLLGSGAGRRRPAGGVEADPRPRRGSQLDGPRTAQEPAR